MNTRVKMYASPLRTTLVAMLLAALSWSAGTVGAESGAEQFDRQMEPILRSYLKVGDTLAADSVKGVRAAAASINKLAAKLDPRTVTGEQASHYEDVRAKLRSTSASLAKAKTLGEARAAYKGLSVPMGMWASMSKPKGVDVVYCPMAKASWLQQQGAIRNPYYGSEMLRCGQIVKAD